jgi:hypothetical protein
MRPPPKIPRKIRTRPLMIIAATDCEVCMGRFSISAILARPRIPFH